MSSMSPCFLHPDLRDCRRIFLRNYVIHANIGIHAHEKNGAQRILLNVDLFVPLSLCTPKQDRIEEVLDYDFIRNTVQQRVAQGHINLQETLCDDIAQALLSHPQVTAVRISSEKPDVYPDSDAVGVEVFRLRGRGSV